MGVSGQLPDSIFWPSQPRRSRCRCRWRWRWRYRDAEMQMAEIFRNRSACAKCWAGNRKTQTFAGELLGIFCCVVLYVVCGFCAWSIGRWVVINAMQRLTHRQTHREDRLWLRRWLRTLAERHTRQRKKEPRAARFWHRYAPNMATAPPPHHHL